VGFILILTYFLFTILLNIGFSVITQQHLSCCFPSSPPKMERWTRLVRRWILVMLLYPCPPSYVPPKGVNQRFLYVPAFTHFVQLVHRRWIAGELEHLSTCTNQRFVRWIRWTVCNSSPPVVPPLSSCPAIHLRWTSWISWTPDPPKVFQLRWTKVDKQGQGGKGTRAGTK
jgi:hypothetical protein